MNRHAEPFSSPKFERLVIVRERCIEESAVLGDDPEFHGESSWIVPNPKTNAFGESTVAGSKKGPSVDFEDQSLRLGPEREAVRLEQGLPDLPDRTVQLLLK